MRAKNRTADEVWRQLKQWARDVGNSEVPVPDADRCEKQVERIAGEVLGWRLPEPVVHFYAREARTMIDEIRLSRSNAHAT